MAITVRRSSDLSLVVTLSNSVNLVLKKKLDYSARNNRHAHLSPQPGPSSRHQAAAAAVAAAAALCLSPQHPLNAAAAAAAGQPLYHQPDLYRR